MPDESAVNIKSPFNRLHAIEKLIICVSISVLLFLCIPSENIGLLTHLLFAWDGFSISMLIVTWITFITTASGEMRSQAKVQDETRTLIFIIVLISTCASMLAVILLLAAKDAIKLNKELHLLAAVGTMTFSWLLVHTIFALRYAHLFYGDHPDRTGDIASGLNFPEEQQPDYLDFAYFSFVLGMTFQVSDVEITSRRIRRIALMHGILSFGFNTIIVALTINVIAGLHK